MKKYIRNTIVLTLALSLVGCGVAKPEKEAIEEQIMEQIEESNDLVETKIISPLPITIDMNQLDNCTVAVSFEEGDAYVDDTGIMRLDVTVYTYDLYDMVDISLLEEGDTIVIRNQEVHVTSLERNDLGLVSLNGGEENGGYDLFTDNSGVYYEMGFNDTKAYYPLGEATIRVSVDFEFYDNSDLEAGEKIYYPGDFLIKDAGIQYDFRVDNTTIVIEDGQIIAMNRVYTP
ncbi:MAG: hypothetical protein IKY94_06165 [Lachnospiraceae bacterium]|nr:hypothetical protein [Lachnospiraceae bacterium]